MNTTNHHIAVWKSMDWKTLFIYFIFVFSGWLVIYSASYNFDELSLFNFETSAGKQLIWIGVSLVVALGIMLLDARWYYNFAYYLYILMMLVLAATIVLAPEIKGSRSWLVFGPISIQPAEFAKFATALALARYMGDNGLNANTSKPDFRSLLMIFLPIALIFLQHETGSALVYLSFFFMLYREGMSGIYLFYGVCMIVYFLLGIRFGNEMLWTYTSLGNFLVLLIIAITLVGMFYVYNKDKKVCLYLLLGNIVPILLAVACCQWFRAFNICYLQMLLLALFVLYFLVVLFKRELRGIWVMILYVLLSVGFLYATDYAFENVLQAHQQTRMMVLLGMTDDPNGDGYNVNQAKISIGSGGAIGKGYLNGTQTKLKYVPEQDTDFIFCTVGEEFGFVGSFFLLALYAYFLIRLILMADRQKDRFVRVYGYCVVCVFFFHLLINIGMVLGLMPVIGIPLPFFSYGGSPLLSFTILLFIFLRLDAESMQRR